MNVFVPKTYKPRWKRRTPVTPRDFYGLAAPSPPYESIYDMFVRLSLLRDPPVTFVVPTPLRLWRPSDFTIPLALGATIKCDL